MKKYNIVYRHNGSNVITCRDYVKSFTEVIHNYSNYLTNVSFNDMENLIEFMKKDWDISSLQEKLIRVFFENGGIEIDIYPLFSGKVNSMSIDQPTKIKELLVEAINKEDG